jgi:DNA replication protein DnaC
MSTSVRLGSSERQSLGWAVEEFLRLRGRPADSRVPGPADPASPAQMVQLRAIHYPDGRVAYPELGLICAAGETLAQALARKKRQFVAELFRRAMVPVACREWDFDTFPVEGGKAVAFRMALAYAQASPQGPVRGAAWRENLLLVGATGTGKTGLAICILKARLEQGLPSLFVSVPDLLDKIRATFDGRGNYDQLMEAVKAVDLLALDDLGAHHATDWAREKLFQIIGHRHDWLLPTVITSDRPLAELQEIVGRRVLARIVEHGQVVQIGGRDLRRPKQELRDQRHVDEGGRRT